MKDIAHDDVMARILKNDPAYALQLLESVEKHATPSEVAVLFRVMNLAFGTKWRSFLTEHQKSFHNTFSTDPAPSQICKDP
ncbi:transcriptional regulator [Pseudomonas sp. PDM02]|uniref:transcriptional regulator n=1 Tax=Pseudomonas sp. PDM02 TaxID=2769267 RepID=UPI0017807AEC|nr:transcriptional regulator [Pseudomonas sp. PDM02]MBD9612183.1 transcriptional regulator [Pseudomonas sp. PDM02]